MLWDEQGCARSPTNQTTRTITTTMSTLTLPIIKSGETWDTWQWAVERAIKNLRLEDWIPLRKKPAKDEDPYYVRDPPPEPAADATVEQISLYKWRYDHFDKVQRDVANLNDAMIKSAQGTVNFRGLLSPAETYHTIQI